MTLSILTVSTFGTFIVGHLLGDLLLSLVRESSFISWKVVIWVILDVNPINRFGPLYRSIVPNSLIRYIDHRIKIY